jgi:hypothetical protein
MVVKRREASMALKATLPTNFILDPRKHAQAFGSYHASGRQNLAKVSPGKFDYPTQLVGQTPDGRVSVYYDTGLQPQGVDLARQVLISSASIYAECQGYFSVQGRPVSVIIAAVNSVTDGSGGAYHKGCDFISGADLYCDVAFGNLPLTCALIVAELTECFMGLQNKGWDCGGSNGEALSRFLAQDYSGGPDGPLAEYATAQQWEAAGRPDWIDATAPTDQDPVSIGCGIVYLYWMKSKGITPAQITQAGCPDGTLQSNYSALTGQANAWTEFSTALAKLPGPIASDNPWQAPSASQQVQLGQSRAQILIDAVSRTVTLTSDWNVRQATSEAGSDRVAARADGSS